MKPLKPHQRQSVIEWTIIVVTLTIYILMGIFK